MLMFSIWLRDAEPFVVVDGLPGRNPGKPELKGESAELALRVYEIASGRRRPRRPEWALRAEARVPGKLTLRLEEALRLFEADPTLESAELLLDAWFQASVRLYGKEATVAFYERQVKPQLVSFQETVPASAPDRVRRWRRAMRAWLRHVRRTLREMTALDLARRLPHNSWEEVRVFGNSVPSPSVPTASSGPASSAAQPQRGRPKKDWRKVLEEKLLLQLEAERRKAERRKAKIERRKQKRAALAEEVREPVHAEPVQSEPVQPVQEPVQAVQPVQEPVQQTVPPEPVQAVQQPVQQPVRAAQQPVQPVVAAAPVFVSGGAKVADDTPPIAVRRVAALFRPRR